MIDLLPLTFGSRMKNQEIFLLLRDMKPVVRQLYSDEEMSRVVDFCKSNDLVLIKSEFRVSVNPDESFLDTGIVSKEGFIIVYISKSFDIARQAKHAEMQNDYKSLGLLLGYPNCCIVFFTKNFSAKNTNLTHKPANPYTNLTRRKNDYCILNHFPCSSDCEKSIGLAKGYLTVFPEDYTKELLTELKL